MAVLRTSSQKLNHLLARTTTCATLYPPLLRLLRLTPRHFSTEDVQPPLPQRQHFQQPPPHQSYDSFYTPTQGEVYGRLLGINEDTLKTDIITMLEGCNLTPDDIKVDYNRMFYPMAILLRFPSHSEFTAASREISRKGRLVKLEKIESRQWDITTPYNGSYVLLQGIPRNALMDDVERFLSGCNYDSSSVELFTRSAYPDVIKMAKVRFPSPTEAMNAIIQKNGNFCLNSRIVTRLIQ